MNKNYFLISLILSIVLITGCIQQPLTTKKQDVQIEDIYECLKKQEVVYKPGWEGEPTRVPNQCEIFARKTDNVSAINILVGTEDIPTLATLSKNSNSPTEVLTKIYQRKDIPDAWQGEIKIGLGGNKNTTPVVLTELGKFDVNEKYKDIHILAEVAKNPSTPVNTLEDLARHKHSYVLSDLAGNPNTPEDILVYLSQDLEEVVHRFKGEEDIRIQLAKNPSTPKEILIKFLMEKGNTSVVLNFRDNIVRIENEILELENYYSERFPHRYYSLLEQLVTNPKTSENTLKIIIGRNYSHVSYSDKTLTEWAQDNLNNRK